MGAPGKSVVVESGKRGVLLGGKSAVYDAEESCPACCIEFSQIWSFTDQGFIDGGQAATDHSRQASQRTTYPEAIVESKRLFEICKACEHGRDNAFACNLYHGCCFGKFRSNPASQCPIGK